MPSTVSSSSHSRTQTSSSLRRLSASSMSLPRSASSAAGSFSTILSDPFLHADDLQGNDSTIQYVPSYYFTESPQPSARLTSRRQDAHLPELPPTPTSSTAHLTQGRRPPTKLLHLIRTSDLETPLQDTLVAMVRMIVYISRKLFPTSHVLREDVALDVKGIAVDMCEFLDLVMQKLEHRLQTVRAARKRLPKQQSQEEKPALEEVAKWIEIADELHNPTGTEARIFRKMATLYEKFIYVPFLQLHRVEPTHNMYSLDPFLEAIFIRLRRISNDAATADKLVREIEMAFDAAVISTNSDSKRHVPSLSVPVARAPRVMLLRQRENTL